MMNWAARVAFLLIRPIAWPGWGIEHLVQTRRPGWQFSTLTAVPYFLCVFAFATTGVILLPLPYAWIAFYPVGAAFVLATWLSIAIAIGKRGPAYLLLREMARREYPIPHEPLLGRRKSVFAAACAYAFTSYFFGLWYFMVSRMHADSFSGITAGGLLWQAWQFQYFSAVTIATIGYGDIHPMRFLAQSGVVLEAGAGVFYVVFLFAAIISYHVGRLGTS